MDWFVVLTLNGLDFVCINAVTDIVSLSLCKYQNDGGIFQVQPISDVLYSNNFINVL